MPGAPDDDYPNQSMPRSIAAAIVEVVAADIECQRLIPTASLYNIAQRAAGSARNLVNMTMEGLAYVGQNPGGAKDWWEQRGVDEACTTIADVTSAAIRKAAGRGRLTWVTSADPVDRVPGEGATKAYHTATGVTVGDGKRYVFDWHSTLSRRNPLIYRSVDDFKRANSKNASLYSTFMGWG